MTRLHVCGYITFTRDFIQFVKDMTRLHVCGYITIFGLLKVWFRQAGFTVVVNDNLGY